MPQLLALLLLAVSFPAAADIYKWTDANGRVHFGDSAAGAGQRTQAVTPAAARAPAPGAGDTGASLQERAERLRRLNAAQQQEAAAQQREADQRARAKAFRDEECQRLRQELQTMEGRPVYLTDDKGERRYLDDAERQTYVDQAHRHLKTECP